MYNDFTDFFGYMPVAPALVPKSVAPSTNGNPFSANVDLSVDPQAVSVSTDFAVTGWLLTLLGILAIGYVVWELSE